MSTTRLLTRGVLSLVLVVALAGSGLAVDRDTTNDTYRTTDDAYHWGVPPVDSQAQLGGQGAPFDDTDTSALLRRASRITGAMVKSPDGTNLGRIHDIVLTPDHSEISYVVLSRGGVFGLGRNLYAVPWTALSPGLNRTYVAQITEQQLLATGGFSGGEWPSAPAIGLQMEDREAIGDTRDVHARRFTRITGTPVRTTDDRPNGNIQDLVIATDSGQVAYTIVSYGGLFGLGSRLAAVPHNAITLEPGLNVARIDASQDTVRAYSSEPGGWPALTSPSYSQQLAQSYGVEPTGTALGFVPADEGPVAAAPAPRTERRPETRPARPSTPPAAPAEPTAAQLQGTFDPANITTIQGTVMDTGKYRATAAPGMTDRDMLWLRVRTEDGQTTLVNLGPRDYISRQNFFIVRGDQIRLTGSHVATAAAGRRVFLPTELMYNNQTLKLRNETGTALWKEQADRPQPRAEAPTPEPETPLGFVPAEERPETKTLRPERDTERPETEFTPSGLIALGAFDVGSPRTIEGTITEVGKSEVPDAQEVIWLRIRTIDGQSINVQVGPRDYISRQNFFVVSGDRVRMTGWNAHIADVPGATPVFILADIAQNDSVLQLRNRSGEPLWTTQMGTAEQQPGTQTPGQPMRTPETEDVEDDVEDDTDML
jgi:sporulation protein YlmC with PRC-barrel domain